MNMPTIPHRSVEAVVTAPAPAPDPMVQISIRLPADMANAALALAAKHRRNRSWIFREAMRTGLRHFGEDAGGRRDGAA